MPALFTRTTTLKVGSAALPGSSPMEWLHGFGLPNLENVNFSDLGKFPAFVCWLSDAVTLNLNVTGALIENLSEYATTLKDRTSNCLVPHWIRNDSGLVCPLSLLARVDHHVIFISWALFFF